MNREVGKVKWYGGLNSKTGRFNDYGFISHIINSEDLYFKKRDIKCSENYLKQDALVSFYVKTVTKKNGNISYQSFDIDFTSQLFPLFRNEDSMLILFDDISLDDITMLLGDISCDKGDLTSCVEKKESSTNKCYKWSLRHFLVAKSIQIKFPRVTLDVDKYIQKIKAWANFVQNNSQRLKCRFCGELMTFNPEYSKYSTTQEITVFWCPNADPIECSGISGLQGRNHNYNVYINYCWNCYKTVDSRDSLQYYGINYKSDGWVKCINCGAGRKPGR